MLLINSKMSLILLISFLISAGSLFAQSEKSCCSDKKEKKECCKTECKDAENCKDNSHKHKMHKMNESSSSDESSGSIIREGEIDLLAIDVNSDGMVYQDQMCWNVISDEKGECPLCGMKLKKVTLEEAKANLEENDFEVK